MNRYLEKISSFLEMNRGPSIDHGSEAMSSYPQDPVVAPSLRGMPSRVDLLRKIQKPQISSENSGALINAITVGPV